MSDRDLVPGAGRWLLIAALLGGCGRSSSSLTAGSCPGAANEPGLAAIAVHRADTQPAWVLVPREGDPRGAVAAVIVTGGSSYVSTVLSALLEARVQRAGFASADARADRDSFRLRALVESPERAVEFTRAVARALATPVAPGAAELGLVSKRVASLRRHPFEAPVSAAIARCSGELGLLTSEPAPEPTSKEGVAVLEAARVAAYGAARVAFGVVGTAAMTESVGDALKGAGPWPKGGPVDASPWEDEVGVFSSSARTAGLSRLTVAAAQRRADLAVDTASRAGNVDGALVARLRGLAVPFRVLEVTATARPHGGCVAATLESLRPLPAAGFEDAAAVAAAIVRQEIEGAPSPDDEDRSDRNVGYAGSQAVRKATDPREAAELAASWALTAPVDTSERGHVAVALALGAPSDAREGSEALATRQQAGAKRLAASLEALQKAWNAPVIERRDRVERGQGELWVLAASTCGVFAEGETDAGMTALALTAALTTRSRESRGVTLEPWIASDGVGVLAHGARLAGETPVGHAERVAEEAARALAVFPFAPGPFAGARAALLGRVGDGVAPDGKAMNALAGTLVPGHPSWLAPLGAWDGLAKAGAEAASLRWSALTGGPLRVAVLANDGQPQADAAARVVDRWLVRSPQSRVCPPVESSPSPKAGTLSVSVASAPPLAQALVGVGVPAQGLDATWAELTLAGLGGGEGWLAKAMASPSLGATAQARLVGGPRAAALVVDVRAPESSLEPAVAQVRALFERLRQGAMAASDYERSTAQRERWELEASLDPRRRIVDLWRDPKSASPAAALSLDAWRAWAAGALRDDKLVVVLARPRH